MQSIRAFGIDAARAAGSDRSILGYPWGPGPADGAETGLVGGNKGLS